MLKVAVCFYGNMRSWDWVKKNNLLFFGKQPDYFVHTTDRVQRDFRYNYDFDYIPEHYPEFTSEQLEDDFKDHNLINYTIADYATTNAEIYDNGNAYKVPYFFEKVINLKRQHELENDFEYDIVVLVRTDLIFLASDNTMNWNDLVTDHEWLISDYRHALFNDQFMECHDYFFMGTNATIDHLGNVNEFKEHLTKLNRVQLTPEQILFDYLQRYHIRILPDSSFHQSGLSNLLEYILLPVEHEYEEDFFEDMHFEKINEIRTEYRRLRVEGRTSYAIRSSYKPTNG